MLNFMLKDQYTIVYKEKQEIKIERDNDGMLRMISPSNQAELDKDIREYFMMNPFGRIFANISQREISIATLVTMYHFLTNVKKDYYILKEQFNKVDNKNYKALLAIRQKEGVNTDKEHMKLLWFEGELKTKEEAIAVMEENFPNWCDGYNYIAIPLSSYQDFLKEIKK